MDKLPRGLQATRGVLLVLNILFVLFGLALFIFGIYLIASKSFDVAFFDDVSVEIVGGDAIQTLGIILTVTGFFTILLSVFGCLGTLLQRSGLLYLYGVILIILMILELAAFITAFVTHTRINDSYRTGLRNIFNTSYVENKTKIRENFEKLEQSFKCCGVDGSIDYTTLDYDIPESCYANPDVNGTLYSKGCADACIDWIWSILPAVSGIVGAVLFFEIFGVIASILLAITLSQRTYAEIHGNL